jgi:hypothetical protein
MLLIQKLEKLLTDDYTTNLYDFRTKIQCFSVLPTIGFNPDDGKIGIITNYAINHFNQNPYTRKHTLKLIIILPPGRGFELLNSLYKKQ